MAVTKTMTVPKLRFHEFNDEWQVKKLGNIISKISSGVSVNSEDRPKISGEVGILKTSAVYDGQFKPEENKRILGDEIKRAKLHPVKDSIIVSRMNTPDLVGEIGYVSQDFNELFIPDRLWLCKINSENSAKYLSYVLSSNKIRSVLKSLATGTSNSMKNISQPSFLAISITLPLESEQKKIAAFLTAVDDKCNTLQQKIDLMKKYKLGASQALFTQNLRFKDNNNNYPSWQEKKIREIFEERNERGLGGVMFSVTINSGIVPFSSVDRKDNSNKDKSKYKNVMAGDIAYNTMRMWQGASGVAIADGIVSPAYTVLKPINGQLSRFYGYYFKLPGVVNKFGRYSQGLTSDTLNLKYPQLAQIEINIPYKEEQQKIADFLTALDDMINLEESKLEQAKLFKNYLLKRMFV